MSAKDHSERDDRFDALARTVITEDADLNAALKRVAVTGCGLLANCKSASVTIIEGGRAVTVGSTSPIADVLDAVQYAADTGPCLDAARSNRSIRIDDMRTERRWPQFGASAVEHEVYSSLSLPLDLAADGTVAGFNVYGAEPDGFTEDDERLCEAFAAQAAIVVSNAHAYWKALALAHNLSTAMDSRAVIEQAKGVMIASEGVTAEEAFNLLRQQSQAENRKLRDVAADIVTEAGGDRNG